MSSVTLPRQDIPLVGVELISRDWYRWARDITARTGGVNGVAQAFPVGSVFVSVVATSPATLLGYGTWEAIGAGKVLIGQDTTDPDFDTLGETGGAKTVASAGTNASTVVADHPAHTHTYTEVPNHTHPVNITDPGHTHVVSTSETDGTVARADAASGAQTGTFNTNSATTGITATTSNPTGGVATGTTNGTALTHDTHTHAFTGSATSVVQPFLVVKFWKRTA